MTEEKKETNVTPLPGVTPPTRPVSNQSLEERLDAARAKRARILAQKGKSEDEPPKLTKPWLDAGQQEDAEDDFDPAARVARIASRDPSSPYAPPVPPQKETRSPFDFDPESRSDAPTAPTSPQPEVEPRPAPTARRRSLPPLPEMELSAPRPAFNMALVAAIFLFLGAVLANLDRLSELPDQVRSAPPAPAPEIVRIEAAPSSGDGFARMTVAPALSPPAMDDAAPRPARIGQISTVSTPDYLAPVQTASRAVLPNRGAELSLTMRTDIGRSDFDVPPTFDARVRIFAPGSVSDADVDRVAEFLEGYELEIGAVTPVSFSIASNEVRYSDRTDRDTARHLARLLGAAVRQYPPGALRNRPGIVEVWIAGE